MEPRSTKSIGREIGTGGKSGRDRIAPREAATSGMKRNIEDRKGGRNRDVGTRATCGDEPPSAGGSRNGSWLLYQAETFRQRRFLMMPPEDGARIQRTSTSYQSVLYAGPMAMTARPSRAVGETDDRRLPAVSRGYTVTRSAGTGSTISAAIPSQKTGASPQRSPRVMRFPSRVRSWAP